jgi:hypothetical protein
MTHQLAEIAPREIDSEDLETAIETATRCSCGCPVSIVEDGPRWAALCVDCYSSERVHVIGRAASVHAALWAWQEAHDEAHEVEWHLADLFGEIAHQVREETDRQQRWGYSPAQDDPAADRLYGPMDGSA